jgi:hypothetical protein
MSVLLQNDPQFTGILGGNLEVPLQALVWGGIREFEEPMYAVVKPVKSEFCESPENFSQIRP